MIVGSEQRHAKSVSFLQPPAKRVRVLQQSVGVLRPLVLEQRVAQEAAGVVLRGVSSWSGEEGEEVTRARGQGDAASKKMYKLLVRP